MFIVFKIMIRHVSKFWRCNVLLCFTFKICSLIIILRKFPRIIFKDFIRLKTFSSLIKVTSSLIIQVRYAFFHIFTLFITGVSFSHCLFKGLWIIKFNYVLETSRKIDQKPLYFSFFCQLYTVHILVNLKIYCLNLS